MRNCLAGSAPHDLRAYCTTVSSLSIRSSLQSSARDYLVVRGCVLLWRSQRSIAIVDHTGWNRLAQSLRTYLLSISFDESRHDLKTFLLTSEYAVARVGSASDLEPRYINT